jgi:hypothetical protein
MVWIGMISYSLYLWHWPIMAFVRNRLFTVELEPMWQVGTVLASVLVGWISWRIVERPFRVPLRAGGMSRARIFVLSGAGMAVLGTLAGAVVLTGGMATQRFSDAQLAALPQEPLRNAYRNRCFGPRPAERFCTFGNYDPAAPVEWFLWGDSHADAMLPALIDLAEARNVKLAFAGHPACIPLPGLLRNRQGRVNTTCLNHNRTAVRFVEQNPSIKVVFLHARWAIYTDGFYEHEGPIDFILYEEREEPPETVDFARNAALVEANLESLVEGLSQPDRDVVLIGPTPEVRWDVPRRRAAEVLFDWPIPPAPTPDEVAARQAVSSAIFARVAAKTDSLFIPMAQSICAEECVLFTESEMYYGAVNLRGGMRAVYRERDVLRGRRSPLGSWGKAQGAATAGTGSDRDPERSQRRRYVRPCPRFLSSFPPSAPGTLPRSNAPWWPMQMSTRNGSWSTTVREADTTTSSPRCPTLFA